MKIKHRRKVTKVEEVAVEISKMILVHDTSLEAILLDEDGVPLPLSYNIDTNDLLPGLEEFIIDVNTGKILNWPGLKEKDVALAINQSVDGDDDKEEVVTTVPTTLDEEEESGDEDEDD